MNSVYYDEIESIEVCENEGVYDLTVDDNHNFFANGLLVHNCGEIVLSPNDSCRLMVVNLANFVQKPFTKHARFNFKRFATVVQKAQRLMDDLIDLEIECIDKIIDKVKNDAEPENVKRTELELWQDIKRVALIGRRTGLGVTALGDAVAMLGIKYGSDESIEVIESFYKELGVNAHISSCRLAAERGAFSIYDPQREKGNPYLKRMLAESSELRELYKAHGRRNIALTTTAPCGSVSIISQTTSGIEPLFMTGYRRRRKIVEGEDITPDFVDDVGDKWTSYDVYHHGIKKWMEVTGDDNVENSPYFGATANDINWTNRVKIQAAAQKWISHSISSTVNLPSDVSKEVVKEIYETAWKSGCKGLTVYRDGSRSGVLISKDSNPNAKPKFEAHSAPKRPGTLDCDIHHATIKGEKWVVLVGLMDGRPYEIMGGLADLVEIPRKYKTGLIIKHPRKTMNSIYDLKFGENGDEITIKNIVRVFDNPNYASFTRVISLGLRHGTPAQYLTEQLRKDKDADMFSFSSVIARVLKNYIEDGAKSSSKNCDECGTEGSMIYQEGCELCANCGWSKC